MSYQVQIKRLELNALIDIQGERNAVASWMSDDFPPFPENPNSSCQHDGLSLYWIAPERWLLRSAIENEERIISITRLDTAPQDISIVLVSDTVQLFQVTGADADEIISIASSIDCHVSAFPGNGVSYTDIFGIKGLLMRCENGFEIAVESSYADMIEDYLSRATA